MDDYSAGKKAASYWFIDGLPEILYGGAFAMWGLAGVLAGAFLPKIALVLIMVPLAITLAVLAGRDGKILDYFKARITYPRSGYVAPPENENFADANRPISLFGYPSQKSNVTTFRNRTVFLILQTANLSASAGSKWMPVLVMTIIGGTLYGLSRNSERPYSLMSVAVLAVGGFIPSTLSLTRTTQAFLPSVWCGVWLLSLGLFRLVRYLHDNPLPHGAHA